MKKEREMAVVALMIELYCKKNHSGKAGAKCSTSKAGAKCSTDREDALCPDCAGLLEYVKLRREKCPFKDDKPFCQNCKIHCYRAEMREKIRLVMRFSGPRMMLRHPIIALRHMAQSKRQKKKIKKEGKNNVR